MVKSKFIFIIIILYYIIIFDLMVLDCVDIRKMKMDLFYFVFFFFILLGNFFMILFVDLNFNEIVLNLLLYELLY